MDFKPSRVNLYRYDFRDLLLKRAQNRPTANSPRAEPLIADIFVSRPSTNFPPAPQGIGEMKHSSTKKRENPDIDENGDMIKQVKETDGAWMPDAALAYNADIRYYKPALEVRQRMENEVRKHKKSGLPCPHADKNFHCSALFIRCGDRIQFANPETLEQKNLPHDCLYRPKQTGKYVLIVDDNKAIREFCKNSIELFFNYDSSRIITAGSGPEAVKALNQFKLEGKQCGLLICDTELPGFSGFDVVDQLFERNFNTEVILTKKQNRTASQPPNFKGMQEIVPKKTVVKKIITKPFHSQTFINALKSVDINHLFD